MNPRRRPFNWTFFLALLEGLGILLHSPPSTRAALPSLDSPIASSSIKDFPAAGAIDGDRFSVGTNAAWKGAPNKSHWWWEIHFASPQNIGAILQVVGDHEFVHRNAPRQYVWQVKEAGDDWRDLSETSLANDRRLFRLHRLRVAVRAQAMRLDIRGVDGEFPTLREVEFLARPHQPLKFPDWILAVNTTHESKLPGEGKNFIPLARSCPGWAELGAQQIWLDAFDEAFVAAEPRPLCALLSGNFKDWCEVDRNLWRGTGEVLRQKHLPLWASCGGAQGLALLSEYGVDQPWDCPHCRDPAHPQTPLYTHIGHTAQKPCGDYSACIFERGPHQIRQLRNDPVFADIPEVFAAMESHCGQIDHPPKGWLAIATAGPGTQTQMQCLRLQDRPIYAAQFHIELPGTPEISRKIMGRFLNLSKQWGGFNLAPPPMPEPSPW